MITSFDADEVFIKQRKMDKSWTVEFGVGEYQYEKIKNLPLLQGKIIKVIIEDGDS